MKKTFSSLIVLVLMLPLLFSNCASIVSNTTYAVHIRTTPVGANIVITNKKGEEVFRGVGPATATLKSGAGYFSKAKYDVKISAPGYADKTVPVYFKVNGWYWGNLLFGGPLGLLIIDPLTGAMWKIIDPIVDESLEKTTAGTVPTLKIIDIKEVPDSLRKNLVRL